MILRRTGIRFMAGRGLAIAAVVASVGILGAKPFTPGMTYRIRLNTSMPDMPGMPGGGNMVIVGHGIAVGSSSRVDIDTVPAMAQSGFSAGDYLLILDSSRVVAVSPSSKTYVDGFSMAMESMPPDMMAMAAVSNVSVNVEKLGAGDVVEGRPTEKYRTTAQYTLQIMGQAMNMAIESEILTAQLPAAVRSPFAGSMPKSFATGPFAELYAKMNEAQKQLSGTALKVVSTTSVSGPMSMTVSQTVEISDVKAVDVDEKLLQIPAGFTARPPTL